MKKQIEYPERHISGIGVAVFRSVEVLLVKRKKLHTKELWNILGVKQRIGETITQATHRE